MDKLIVQLTRNHDHLAGGLRLDKIDPN